MADTKLLHSFSDKLFLAILCFVFIIVAMNLIFVPIANWDDVVQHAPLINQFSEDGAFGKNFPPKNDLELRSNRYPLLFEATVALEKMNSDSDYWKLMPLCILIFSAYLIYLISKECGFPSLAGSVFFVVSQKTIMLSTTYYVDIYLSLCLLTAVYFTIRYFKTNDERYLILAGTCSALGILTKFTGIIFFVLLATFVLMKKGINSFLKISAVTTLISLCYIVNQIVNFGWDIQIGIGTYGQIATNNILLVILRNIAEIVKILIDFNIGLWLLPIVFLFFIASNYRKDLDGNLKTLNKITLIFTIGFITIFALSEHLPNKWGFPRYFYPAYALLCTSAGLYLEQQAGRMKKFLFYLAILLITISLLMTTYNLIEILKSDDNDWQAGPVWNVLPNEKNTKIFYPISNAVHLGFEKSELVDSMSYSYYDSNACRFINNNQIDYVVLVEFDNWQNKTWPFGENKFEFMKNLEIELEAHDCTEVISQNMKFKILKVIK
ncbi:MAG: glycosyltransferase family 39 protein [Candidatus Diapherotrites archaeon]